MNSESARKSPQELKNQAWQALREAEKIVPCVAVMDSNWAGLINSLKLQLQTLTFGGKHYAPVEDVGVIDLKDACLCPTSHRLLSRMQELRNYRKFGTFTVMAQDAKEYLYSFYTRRRVCKFQDIKVNLYSILNLIQLSGIPAVSERRETDSQIVLTITIPKERYQFWKFSCCAKSCFAPHKPPFPANNTRGNARQGEESL